MKTLFIFILVLVVCSCMTTAGVAQVQPAPEKSVLPAGAPTVPDASILRAKAVSVTFTATDGNGVPLKGVTADQVLVFEKEQVGQVVEVQSAADEPLDLAIVLLASKGSKDKFAQQQAAAIELVQKLIRPGKDRAFVITARGDKPWQGARMNWSMDPAALEQTIRGLDRDSGLPDAFTYEVKQDTSHLTRMWTQPIAAPPNFTIFNVIFAMMQTDPRPVRKAAVLFREPMAHAPGWGERSSQMSDQVHDQIVGIGEGMGVAFYTIASDLQSSDIETAKSNIGSSYTPTFAGQGADTRAMDEDFMKWKKSQFNAGRSNIERLADQTGGRAYWTSKKNFTDATMGIIAELGARSRLSFIPPDVPASGPIHPLKIQVARAARVSAPHGYASPKKSQ